MEFQYKAMKTDGEVFEGIYVAESIEDVALMLRNNKSYPIKIDVYHKIGSQEISFNKKVTAKDLSFFCRQLHAMLNAGSTIVRCLDIMSQQLDNRQLRKAVTQMYSDVQKGKMISEAMMDHPTIFPDLMIYMIESGELGGNLDELLLRLANYFEKDAKLKNKVKTAMIYPTVLLVLAVCVVTFLIVFIMPTFTGMFTSSGVELPAPTRLLLGISDFVRGNGLVLVGSIALVVLVFRQIIHSNKGRRTYDGLKLKLPILKGLTVKIMTARFSRNLSTMLSSGVPLLTALDNVSRLIGNKVVAEAIQDYREEIQKGNELHQVVRDSAIFPPMLDNMMEIGKESGALDNILEKTADYYDDEAEQELQRVVSLSEPLMIITLAIVIGFIVISMALPMFDMVNTVQ